MGRYAVLPSEVGNVYQAGYQGILSAYTIQNGKIVTTVADSPFEVTVYKVSDKHLAARSNEFGFAQRRAVSSKIGVKASLADTRDGR